MNKVIVVALGCASLILAQKAEDWPSGTRITPPTISRVSPRGIARGMTVEMEIEGFNLARASAIYFSEKGVTGKILRVKELPDMADIRIGANGGLSTIDLGPLPPRNQITVEIDISPEAQIGPVNFRVLTPLGTSPMGTFLIEPFYGEAADSEPNDTIDNAPEVYLPAIFVGTISRNGDVDTYKIKARANQQIVFENGAMLLGSTLQPVVRILGEDQSILAEFGQDGGDSTRVFAHRFEKAGTYYVQITDFQQSGGAGHIYRLKAGEFPIVTGLYPLGLQLGKSAKIHAEGLNVGDGNFEVQGTPSDRDAFALMAHPKLSTGKTFNEVRLELGQHPEVEARAGVNQLAIPSTVNGRLKTEAAFRFHARKGEKLVFEVTARRAGSNVDSFLEVLDGNAKSIEHTVLRPVWETTAVLRDADSAARGIRLNTWNAVQVGDYMMFGAEVLKVSAMPKSPDDDMVFENFNGQRISYFGTSAESHAIDSSIYKVQVHPAGTTFTPNGLPLARLYYRNDDGGPGYGKDSLLQFTAPADGEYQLKLRDVRGELVKAESYRLTARHPEPDFRLTMNPRNVNVAPGSAVPITIQAFRMDGFDGPIPLTVEGLPKGVTATAAVVPPGQVFATILLKSDANAVTDAKAYPIEVVGKVGAQSRYANQEDNLKLLSRMPKPDIQMSAITRVVEIEAGGTAEVNLSVERLNGFKGRIPVAVLNLPPSVRVLDVGLNGVLVNEDETKRGFTLAALPGSENLEQVIYVAGIIETRSPQQNQFAAPEAILLRVKAK